MNPHASPGESNPNAFLDSKGVRELRLLHFCDGMSVSDAARMMGVSVSCGSRLVNFRAWKHQDLDLMGLERPVHKGGGFNNRKVRDKPKEPRHTCRDCLHLTKDGACGFGFPECISSAYREAAKCNAFAPIKPGATTTDPGDAGGGADSGC